MSTEANPRENGSEGGGPAVDGSSPKSTTRSQKRGSFSGILGLIEKSAKNDREKGEGEGMKQVKDMAKELIKRAKNVAKFGSKAASHTTHSAPNFESAEVISEDDDFLQNENDRYKESRKIVYDAIVPYKPRFHGRDAQKEPKHEPAKPSEPDAQTKVNKYLRDTSLYVTLGVSPDASSAEIKKAYFKLARECHPDKHIDDPKAVDRFQMIGEAYQVLMDPKSRESYDTFGKSVLDDNFMDATTFYSMMFGGDKFKHLVGVFTLTFTALENVDKDEIDKFQDAREEELAQILKKRLEKWITNREEFISEAEKEYSELVNENFGLQLLNCIGYTYYHQAEALLGFQSHSLNIPSFLKGVKSSIRQHGHGIKSKFKASQATVKVQTIQEKMESDDAVDPDADFSEKFTPELKESIWLVNVLDIESTLRRVVHRVIVDKSIDKALRKQRALGIINLGKIFQRSNSSNQELSK